MTALDRLREAQRLVRRTAAPTALHRWPMLSGRCGCDVFVKHENHTAIGSFKLRGGLVYIDRLLAREPGATGAIAATRGNHGQSVALAAARAGLRSVIVVPRGNSRDKNAAMRALGAELVEHGHDFQAALEHAVGLAAERGLHMIPSFHDDLVDGVASWALETFDERPDLDVVYVPIGLGSGICGAIRARDALGLKTRIVGVAAEKAAAYALSFSKGGPVPTNSADTIADGMACRVPDPDALREILAGAERIATVTEDEIADAMRVYFRDAHNIAEGAGAAPLAALLKEREAMAGRKVGLVLSGGNIDRAPYARILAGN